MNITIVGGTHAEALYWANQLRLLGDLDKNPTLGTVYNPPRLPPTVPDEPAFIYRVGSGWDGRIYSQWAHEAVITGYAFRSEKDIQRRIDQERPQ